MRVLRFTLSDAHNSRAPSGPILLVGNGDRPEKSTDVHGGLSSGLQLSASQVHSRRRCGHAHRWSETLYLPVPAEDDALWHGVSHTIEEIGAALGFQNVRPSSMLETTAAVDGIATIAIPDLRRTPRASQVSGMPLEFGSRNL